MGHNDAFRLIVGLAIIIALFLTLREFWCWYWKINKALDLLESIDQSLKQLPAISRSRATP